MLRKLLFAAIAVFGMSGVAEAQSSNPFNPDFAWCNVQGAVATRKAATWGCLTPGTAGQVLRTNGASADVSWQTVTGAGTVTSVGLAMPSFITVTGSPVTTTGTLTGTLASQTANQLFIAPNGSAGAPTFRAMAAADMPSGGVISGGVITGTFPALTIGSSQVTSAMIANSTIVAGDIATNTLTNATLAQMATMTVKSNLTGGTANAADNTVNGVLQAQLGSTQGSVAYRNATQWTALAPDAGKILQSNGAGADPSWVSPSAAIPAAVGIGHRLTLTSANPVLSANVSAGTTIYSTPYNSDLLLLWDGSQFVPTHCAETSQLLSDTTKSPAAAAAASNYDLFAWNDSGTCRVTRGPAWTNDTTRATAISRANFGILTNGASITNGPASGFGTYMGTIRTDAGGATITYNGNTNAATCTQIRIPLWNYYNRVALKATQTLSSTSHSYAGALRQYMADANCSAAVVTGAPSDQISIYQNGRLALSQVNQTAQIAIGVNATTAAIGQTSGIFSIQTAAASWTSSVIATYRNNNIVGFATYNALEDANGVSAGFADNNAYSLTYDGAY